ncbi:hypothetical protein EP1X_05640 [Thermococcus sp. EP1]|uniref:hypothetical protein n=1 Tax=Thermococcus sp. EP1 TaxID=1591054 RepID=UPI0006D9CCB1|nr:hypothetical protein [Thermococcus sp. EP1]KPU63032.1 hypothetical protein EP1X_05640 [Thermococcus sp. EP1]
MPAPTFENGLARGIIEIVTATALGFIYEILIEIGNSLPSTLAGGFKLFVFMLILVGALQVIDTLWASEYWNRPYLVGYILGVLSGAFIVMYANLIPDWLTLLEAFVLIMLFLIRISQKEQW